MYLYVGTDCFDILKINQKQYSSQRDHASTVEAAPGRVGRDKQGEARRANTTPNGGPLLELGYLRFITWPKSDFSIAETTWPTYLRRIHLFIFAFFSTLQNIYVSLCGKFC